MSVRRFPVAVLPADGGRVRLDPATSHHLLRVTGIAPGETVELFDAEGKVAPARLVGAVDGRAELDAGVPVRPAADAPRWLLLAVLKGGAFDTAVRMGTELGVDHIVPVLAQRSVARGDRGPRWSRIATSSVAQCGRPSAPTVHPAGSLSEALARLPADVTLFVAAPGAEARSAPAGPAAVCIGPEGGWTTDEVQAIEAAGGQRLGLGRWVLRADTAVAAALARLDAGR